MSDGARQPARIEQLLWVAAIVLGGAYWFGAAARSGLAFATLENLPPTFVVLWKCLATGGLFASAFLASKQATVRPLAIAIGVIWLADLLLAVGYSITSGFVFVLAHIIAGFTFLRLPTRESGKVLAFGIATAALLAACVTLIWVIQMGGTALFAIFPLFSALACLAAARSELPLLWSVLGYGIFFMSDAVVVLGMASPAGPGPWGWLAWLTYFTGLVMMVKGIRTYSVHSDSVRASLHPV